MRFEINCATFARIASVCKHFATTVGQENRDRFSVVRLEVYGGKCYAVATNIKVAAIEFLGFTFDAPDGFAHVKATPELVQRCQDEACVDGVLTVQTIPEIATAMGSTSSGWVVPGEVCEWSENPQLNDWRQWVPEEAPQKHSGVMRWDLPHLQALFESSPSGEILFPEYIDVNKPVVLRDRLSDKWVGLFVPQPKEGEQKRAATLPEWWKQ